MKPTRSRITEKVVISHVTAIAPTLRLLVIAVDVFSGDDGKIESETFVSPVVSIRTTVANLWARRELGGEADPREYADANELREARYQFTGQRLCDEMLVLSPESGESLISLDDLRHESYAVVRVIAATWEPSEDESRLAPIVADAVSDATKRLARQPASERIAS